MLHALLKTLHLLGVVVWVGGMAFAQFSLRPSLTVLDPPARLRLMHEVFGRFFAIVAVAGLLVLFTGGWMMADVAKGGSRVPLAWQAMAGLGVVMLLIFGYVRLALYGRFGRAVVAQDWAAGAAALAPIRRWIAVNLALGAAVIAIVVLGE
jgi:uncharacterized membrane protein